MKILVVLGTRPEAIKLAPVIKFLQEETDFQAHVCVTGQHRSMLNQVMEVFQIERDYDLDLMQPDQMLSDITGRILSGVSNVIRSLRPDWVVVQGDTATAFAASLAAFYEHVPVAHVEAGLRTWNFRAPFPEEMNRKLISSIAGLHFPPTLVAKQNLLGESVPPKSVCISGNTIVDALLWMRKRLKNDDVLRSQIERSFSFLADNHRIVLVTGHRRENFGDPFRNMCHALVDIAKSSNVVIVYPAHLNPNVQAPIHDILKQSSAEIADRIHIIDPLDYPSFVYLMDRAELIITDSGGVQEEAPTFGKPVLVTRDTTERPEAVNAGLARLVGTDRDRIAREALEILNNVSIRDSMRARSNPFGDGFAAARIVERLREASGRRAAVLSEFVDPAMHIQFSEIEAAQPCTC